MILRPLRQVIPVLMVLALVDGAGSASAQGTSTSVEEGVSHTAEEAHDGSRYTAVGPYIQGAFVQAWSRFKAPSGGMGVGADLALGARLHRNLATEIGFEGIYNWDLRGVDTSTYAVLANGKAYLPPGKLGPIRSIQPFVLGGLGTVIEMQGKRTVARFAYRVGAGADLFLTDSFFVSLTYRYTGNFDQFGYTNLSYGFGLKFE